MKANAEMRRAISKPPINGIFGFAALAWASANFVRSFMEFDNWTNELFLLFCRPICGRWAESHLGGWSSDIILSLGAAPHEWGLG